jgi:hypothetical protein
MVEPAWRARRLYQLQYAIRFARAQAQAEVAFGRIRAAIDAADAQQLEAYLTHEQTVRGRCRLLRLPS